MAKFKLNVHRISESFDSIAVVSGCANIMIKPAEDDRCTVIFHEYERVPHTVAVKDGNLLIAHSDQRKWYHRILPSFQMPWISICLPKTVYHTLALKCTTGSISVSSTELNGNLSIESVTGKVTLANVACADLTVHGTTGAVSLSNVVATGSIDLRRTTGKVLLCDCDAAALQIKVTTGNVRGRLLSSKVFSARATTGKIELPEVQIGGKCQVKTTTGDIKFEIKETI